MRRRDDFLIGPKEKLIEAIKSGKTEEALRYAHDLYEMFRGMHDGFINTISLMHGKLPKRMERNGSRGLPETGYIPDGDRYSKQ